MSTTDRHEIRAENGLAGALLRTDLEAIFRPASVAIYGISDRTSQRIAQNMTRPGVPFYGVNPTRAEACGVRCYPTLADCPEVPELVVMGVGHRRIEAALDDVLAVEGVRAIVTPGLGNEAGAEGPAVIARIAPRLADAGVPMVGPNSMGVATPGAPSPWIGTLRETFVGGGVATLVHSGSIGEVLVSLGPRVGFRTVVSAGNEIVRDAADFVAYWAEEPETRVVGLFLETVRRPAAFEAALRRVAEAGKVAIVLKVGTSELGAQAALAHTGALVGSDRSFSAMLRHYGAIRVTDFADFVEHLEVFACRRPLRGARVGAVTNSGGEGEYFADKAEEAGLPLSLFSEPLRRRLSEEFPNFLHVGNPVDCWAIDDDRVVFPRAFELMARSGEFDLLVSCIDHSQWLVGGERELARNIAEDLLAAVEGTEIFPAVVGVTTADPPIEDLEWARRHEIAMLKGTLPGLRALAARLAHAPALPPPRDVPPAPPIAGGGALPEFESAALATAYGIVFPRARRCTTPEEAADAARELGFPAVVKIDGVAHKERVGGVALGLHDPSSVAAAAERMGGRVLVAEQLSGGVEVLAGAVRDPDYGPTVVVGVGGRVAEALDIVSAALAPLDAPGARALVSSLPPLLRLLGGAVPEPLVEALVALSRLAAEHPEIAEIDLNPLLVAPERAVALDCLIVLQETT